MEAPSLLFRLAGSTGQVIGKLASNAEAIGCFFCTPVRTGGQLCSKTFSQTSEMADSLAKKASNLLTVLPEGTQVRPKCFKLMMQSVLRTHNPEVPQVDLPFTAAEVADPMWCAVVCDITEQKLHELQWYHQHSARLQASHINSSTLFCSLCLEYFVGCIGVLTSVMDNCLCAGYISLVLYASSSTGVTF